MRPILFSVRVGGVVMPFPSYGALVALGFVLGIGLLLRSGRRQGFDPGRLQDLAFSSVVLGLVGARVAFVLLNFRAFFEACWPSAAGPVGAGAGDRWVQGGCFGPLRFWDGGLVFYGGAAAVGGVVWLTCRREGWAFLRFGDLAAPSVALGHAVGRIGCLMAGCCYGKPCAAPWAVRFGPGSVAFDEGLAAGRFPPASMSTWTAPLHPTQLYEAIGELAIFVGLVLVERRRAGRVKRDLGRPDGPASSRPTAGEPSSPGPAAPASGYLLGGYVLAHAALRFGVEIFRGDVSRGYLFRWTTPGLAGAVGLGPNEPLFLSTSQAVSLLLIFAALAALAAVGSGRSQLRRRASRKMRR
jgi:phosphatidylglycerol:prolipoprotein diacylglycerol transferase